MLNCLQRILFWWIIVLWIFYCQDFEDVVVWDVLDTFIGNKNHKWNLNYYPSLFAHFALSL